MKETVLVTGASGSLAKKTCEFLKDKFPGDLARIMRPNVPRRNREILLCLIFNFVVSKHE